MDTNSSLQGHFCQWWRYEIGANCNYWPCNLRVLVYKFTQKALEVSKESWHSGIRCSHETETLTCFQSLISVPRRELVLEKTKPYNSQVLERSAMAHMLLSIYQHMDVDVSLKSLWETWQNIKSFQIWRVRCRKLHLNNNSTDAEVLVKIYVMDAILLC